jgi:hypothetical protein
MLNTCKSHAIKQIKELTTFQGVFHAMAHTTHLSFLTLSLTQPTRTERTPPVRNIESARSLP